ncbi:YopX family protein [Streptococcus pluranimalium]
MTVPKFRVWEPYYKKMFANDQIIVWNGNVYVNDTDKITVDNIRGWSIDDKYLMQSTGLFDSSLEPVEIYKDDIVTKSLPNGAVLVGVVTFNKGMFLVDGVEAIDQSWVVIGNIHEHPHLLEGLND